MRQVAAIFGLGRFCRPHRLVDYRVDSRGRLSYTRFSSYAFHEGLILLAKNRRNHYGDQMWDSRPRLSIIFK
jgi:hypothetical protein